MGKPKIIIVEGPRMSGKSRITKYLRNNINYATLINFTGFPDKGEKGYRRITDYYISWTEFIRKQSGTGNIFIFDRYMFSELVFSRLYKDYDFGPTARWLLKEILKVAEVHLYLVEMDDELELKRRLSSRKKVSYSDVEESLAELKKQRDGYMTLYQELSEWKELNLHHISMNGRESIDVAKQIIQEQTGEKSQ